MDIGIIVKDAITEASREIGKVNILIAGRTGVGKSTLINEVFHGRLAETGQGKPVTMETRKIKKKGIPLAIYDTRGLELREYEHIRDELVDLVRKKRAKQDPKHHIHIAWICIAEDSRRVEEAEVWLHSMLAEHMPVLGVITKARSDNGFKACVQKRLPETKQVVRVMAEPEFLDGGVEIPRVGLNDLVEATVGLIPEAFQQAWAASQKASLDLKKKSASKVVKVSAAAAAAVAATPIPVADAVPLVPIQIAMLAKISNIFEIDLSRKFLRTLVFAMAGTTVNTMVGRLLVSRLLKLIPGVGSVAGSFIASATAATLTTTLGEAYITVLAKLFDGAGHEVPSTDEIAREVEDRMRRG